MASTPGLDPWPHWWEASSLTTLVFMNRAPAADFFRGLKLIILPTVLCKRNASKIFPKSAKLLEFWQSKSELSFQKKKRRNFGASVVLMSAEFRKQGDESKRNFAA